MFFFKWILRIAIACIIAIAVSVLLCGYAETHTPWPHWADFCCGHNVPFQWVVTAPLVYFCLRWLAFFRDSRVVRIRPPPT
jgi:hypothetical protein